MDARGRKAGVARAVAVRVALLAGSVCVVAAVGPASAAPAPPTRHAPARVLSPRPGAVLSARPLLIRVRLDRRAKSLEVRLNGHSIGAYFSRRRHGVRRLRVSAAHGLRYGRNVLRVSARRGGKGRRRTRVVRFRVKTDRPLASAGLDRVVAPGDRLKLDGTASRLPPSARRRRARLRYRWSIVRAPGRPRPGAQPVQLSNPSSPTPVVTPTATGSATLQLTVTAPNGETASDEVEIRADPPPSVWLETGAEEGNRYGVRLRGPIEGFYPGEASKWLQIVVLNRQTLEEESNTSYNCPQATEHPYDSVEATQILEKECVPQVQSALAKLKEQPGKHLVIAVNQPGGQPFEQPPVDMFGALTGYINGWGWWKEDEKVERGAFSAVFVPGTGVSTEHPAVHPSGGAGVAQGMIDDTLVRNYKEHNYSLNPAERLPYDTQAPGSSATQNVISIGEQSFEQPLPPGSQGGFQVVVVDSRTLEGESHWFETHSSGHELAKMYDVLKQANEMVEGGSPSPYYPLVFIASRGDPSVGIDEGNFPWFDRLGGEIEALGGTRSRFFAALDSKMSKQNSYTLVGRGSSTPEAPRRAEGDELLGAGPASAGSLNTAPLTGLLARTGSHYTWAVESTDPPATENSGEYALGQGAAQLLQVAGQAPTPWPEQGDPGRTTAVQFIGLKVLGTDTPRSQYWTEPWPGTWGKNAEKIKALQYPTGEVQFSQGDFEWAQQELLQEIEWLEAEHIYLARLAKPFGGAQLASWAALQTIAETVREDVQASKEQQAETEAGEVFEFALALGEQAPLVGEAIGAVNATYHFAISQASVGGEPVGEPFKVKVDELGLQLGERLKEAEKMLTEQLPDAIASDYGRLKTVGSCASTIAENWKNCPYEHTAWQYTQEDQRTAAQALTTTSEVAAYSAILPVEYNAYELPLENIQENEIERPAANYAGISFICTYPFKQSPPSSQFARPVFRQIGLEIENKKETWAVTALGYLTGKGSVAVPWKMHVPEARVTDKLWGTGKGEFGLNREDFFDRSFKATTLPHYPWTISETGWLSACPGSSAARPLSAPRRTSLSRAAGEGIPVGFAVPGDGSSARLTLSLGAAKPGRGAKPKSSLRAGTVLASLRLGNLGAGSHSARIRIRRPLARRVRESKFHRATLWLTTSSPGAGSSTAKRSIALRG
jgi:hypothetical protein